MKTQAHAMKHCQEHAKSPGGDIISTVKPCWPIRSLKKFPVGGDNSACSHVTSQNLQVSLSTEHCNQSFWKSSHWQEFSKMFRFSDLVQHLRVDEQPNHIEKAAVLKITAFVWTGPQMAIVLFTPVFPQPCSWKYINRHFWTPPNQTHQHISSLIETPTPEIDQSD